MEMFEWYVIRATGIVAFLLLYVSVITGLYSQIQKQRKQNMSGTLFLHEALSDWALYLTFGHVVVTLMDKYMTFNLIEVLVPFATDYKPIPMSLGIIAMYFLIMTILTSKARKKIGLQKWRKLHALNPIIYIFVMLHWIFMGTDVQGTILAAINIVPFILIISMMRDKQRLPQAS
ncbi:ferric reductase-like transmembrane domain-containing protein [Neobacillus sp. LXY-1]|uniref:ferric reductase-like transmembrane domain-containing protein n=1 Tax=Neobacillus sp. LXY-1 TaxID=3379133 RepID=UPI003EE3F89E